MLRNKPQNNNRPFELDQENEYDHDSELDDDQPIDDYGNVLETEVIAPVRYENNALAQFLAGYGKNVCEQLIEQFIKHKLDYKQLSLLSDQDLEMLGVTDPQTRSQMLTEFGELPNQDIPRNALESNAYEHNQFNDLVLENVYRHMKNLYGSLCLVLCRIKDHPTENVLINDHTYASDFVLRTLDEFSKTVCNMEKRLLELQYGHLQLGQVKPKSSKKRSTVWFTLATGVFSIGGFLVFRYFKDLNRV